MRPGLAACALLAAALACACGGDDDDDDGPGSGDGSGEDASDDASPDATLVGAFVSFRIDRSSGPCPPQGDCVGFLELLADGTLREDRQNDPGGPVRDATVPAGADLDAALAAFTDPALVAILADDDPPDCPAPTDVFEEMTLVAEDGSYTSTTLGCTDESVAAARAAMNDLVALYPPD